MQNLVRDWIIMWDQSRSKRKQDLMKLERVAGIQQNWVEFQGMRKGCRDVRKLVSES